MAAAFGGALLFACISSLFLDFAHSHRLGNVGIALLALYLSLMVSYRFAIQQDFRKAWQNERAFWSSVLPQIPDMTDGTIIFVLNRGLPSTRFIATNSWADPLVLAQIYQFPPEWKTPPRLFVVSPNWTRSLVQKGGQFSWLIPPATWEPHWEVLPDSNVILMEMEKGKLVRRYGVGWIMSEGQTLHLKPLAPTADPPFPTGILYPLLIPGAE